MRPLNTKTDATDASDRATYATGRAKLKYFQRKVLLSGRAPIVNGALWRFNIWLENVLCMYIIIDSDYDTCRSLLITKWYGIWRLDE